MRNRWVKCASKRNKIESVKRYFNTFATKNPGYIFIIAKKFNDLYDIFITSQQCSVIKRQLEREFGLTGCLDEAVSQEVSWNDCTQKSFENANEFREYRERTLASKNRPLIRAKHAEARQHHNKVKDVFSTNRSSAFQVICFDIEVYEHDRSIMLEIGYVVSRFTPVPYYQSLTSQGDKSDIAVVSKSHLIIRDNLRYKNGDSVPDNRYKFGFGSSETLSLGDAVKRFRDDVVGCNYILGHSVKHDDDYLRKIGVDLSVLGKEMFDTQLLQAYRESLKESEKYFMRGLSYLLKEYNVNYLESHLHNAGCDAFYTMMVFLRQMGYSAEKVNAIVATSKN